MRSNSLERHVPPMQRPGKTSTQEMTPVTLRADGQVTHDVSNFITSKTASKPKQKGLTRMSSKPTPKFRPSGSREGLLDPLSSESLLQPNRFKQQ